MIKLPIEIGDTILAGKFRNRRVEVKTIETDEWGHPTVNGKPILKVRIEKLMKKEGMARFEALLNTPALVGELRVRCSQCGNEFDYSKIPEAGMGYVKCPHCGAIINQEGKGK